MEYVLQSEAKGWHMSLAYSRNTTAHHFLFLSQESGIRGFGAAGGSPQQKALSVCQEAAHFVGQAPGGSEDDRIGEGDALGRLVEGQQEGSKGRKPSGSDHLSDRACKKAVQSWRKRGRTGTVPLK